MAVGREMNGETVRGIWARSGCDHALLSERTGENSYQVRIIILLYILGVFVFASCSALNQVRTQMV